MSAHILDGKVLAGVLKEDLKRQIDEIKSKKGTIPVVVSLLTGSDPSAVSYAESQKKTALSLGIDYRLKILSENISGQEFISVIEGLNEDASVHGILINKPLPAQIDHAAVSNLIKDVKDIEGLNIQNLGKMFLNKARLVPCTAAAVMEHLKFAQVSLKGKDVVVIGRSEIVGKPLVLLLLSQHATVTVCHSHTQNLIEHVRRADVVIVAIGKPNFLQGDWVKPGAVVIDVGINRVDGKIVGDVDFGAVFKVAGAITPVPGGVGPVTSVLLMNNVLEAFKQQTHT